MKFTLDEEQQAFQESIRRFAADRLAPHYQADDRAARMRDGLVAQMAQVGLLGISVPESYGGQGGGAVIAGLAGEEVSRADINAGYLVLISSLIATIITANADEQQRAAWLPRIADGSQLACLCLTEPEHGSDAAALSLRAQPDGSGWRLTGEKTSISMGMDADTALVFARTSDDGARGVSAFYIELDDRHLQRSAFSDLGGRSIGRASLAFDEHPVPATALVGAPGSGFVECMRGFDYSRAVIGMMTLGTAQAAIDDALAYATQRTAFGEPISRRQGVTFPLVELATQIRAARLLCLEALWRKDNGLPHAVEANMVKWWAPKLSVEACHQALLTFGHTGYSDEVPAGQRLRDAIGLEIGDGTAQIAKLVVARQMLGRTFAP